MTANQIAEMLKNWNAIVSKVRAAHPSASDEAVFQIAAQAMNKSLGL